MEFEKCETCVWHDENADIHNCINPLSNLGCINSSMYMNIKDLQECYEYLHKCIDDGK